MERPMTQTSPSAPTPPEKPSFLRRLSQSTAPAAREPPVRQYGGLSSPSTSRLQPGSGVVAGPSYESFARNPPGSAARGEERGSRRSNTALPGRSVSSPSQPTPIAATFAREDIHLPRNPIRPVLASPPNSPPRRTVNSPYDLGGGPVRSDNRTDAGERREPSRRNSRQDGAVLHVIATSRSAIKDAPSLPRTVSLGRFADAETGTVHLPPGALAANIPGSPTENLGRDSTRPPASRRSTKKSDTALISLPLRSSSTLASKQPSSPPALTEASAYARAIASTMPHTARPETAPPSSSGSRRTSSRPLPRPPSMGSESTGGDKPGTRQGIPLHVALDAELPKLAIPKQKRASTPSFAVDFPRSPTLPPLVDPRTKAISCSPVDIWAPSPDGRTLPPKSLPTRQSSQANHHATSKIVEKGPSYPIPAPTSRSQSTRLRRVPRDPSLRPGLAFLLSRPQIQAALLPGLTINSFLSLTGSSPLIRKQFTGESVGRWVMAEWGVQVERERGRSWPNLTVWEGFLESLLHDPASYSTYAPEWHNLLSHLSLSHTLIVLHLRKLPASTFPNPAPLPFEDDALPGTLPLSGSMASLSSSHLPRSRVGSTAGSDAGSVLPTKMPRHERLVEIVMPEPLAAKPADDAASDILPETRKPRRRGSVSSLASAASITFGRKRSNTAGSVDLHADMAASVTGLAAPIASGKAALPPVSYPIAKRYGFKRHGEPTRSRTSSESGRPGSVFSMQSSPSFAYSSRMNGSRTSFAIDRGAPPMPSFPANLPAIVSSKHRASLASSDGTSRFSENGGNSPLQGRSPFPPRRDFLTPPPRIEPAFERPVPYIPGRAPILRVFVPLSDRVPRWPSAEAAAVALRELEKCGAVRKLQLGDLIVNTALRQPKSTEHVLVFVPFIKHLLVPLDYTFSSTGHLPAYVDAFAIPPSYYYSFLPAPQIIYLNLSPFATRALGSIRLAYDRRDVTVASGAKLSAKRYLHVAGFEVTSEDKVAPEWHGMVTLEAEGTAEGKRDLEARLRGDASRAAMWPWELVREKSMTGTIWLKVVKPSA